MQLFDEEIVQSVIASGVVSEHDVRDAASHVSQAPGADGRSADGVIGELTRRGKLTAYQAETVLDGRGGSLVFGEYVVLDRIGQGGMGVVYKARHRRMDRLVAVKRLPQKAVESPTLVQRFYREVKAAAKLMHPNIVAAHDAGEAHGSHYLVMEFVDGPDLSHLIHERGPLPVDLAVDIILQAARGLAYAHDHGIIHRDIKPANMLIAADGTVKLLDMGLARIEQAIEEADAAAELTITQEGRLMGTAEYMAPEQAADAHAADHRADIYALGCTLFRCVTGELPYGGKTAMQKVIAHTNDPIPSLAVAAAEVGADVPAALDAACRRMLEKKPGERYQSMDEVIEALEALVRDERLVRDEAPAPGGALPAREASEPPRADAGRAQAIDIASSHVAEPTAPDAETIAASDPAWRSATDPADHGVSEPADDLRSAVAPSASPDASSIPVALPAGTGRRRRRAQQREARRRKLGALSRPRIILAATVALLAVAGLAFWAIFGNVEAPGPPPRHEATGDTGASQVANTNTTPAADTPRAAVTPADGWIDLLPLIDPDRDAAGAPNDPWVTVAGNSLTLTNPGDKKLLNVPMLLRGDYELRMRVHNAEHAGFALRLPCRDFFTVFWSKVDGRLYINEHIGTQDGTAESDAPVFGQGVEQELLVRVAADGPHRVALTVTLDGRTLLDWTRPNRDLSAKDVFNPAGPAPMIETWRNTLTVRGLHVRMLSGDATPLRPDDGTKIKPAPPVARTAITPADGLIDLLPLIDPAEDAVAGDWAVGGEPDRVLALRADETTRRIVQFSRLTVPVAPAPGRPYRLRVKFDAPQDGRGFGVALPVGDTQVMCGVAMVGGLGLVDGRMIGVSGNPTRCNPSLKASVAYTLDVWVRPGDGQVRINAELDGKPLFDWNGDVSSLSWPPNYPMPIPGALGLVEWSLVPFTVYELKFEMLAGDATLLRPPLDEDAATPRRPGGTARRTPATGATLRKSWAAHSDHARCVAFDPAGGRFASAGFDGEIHLWHARSLEKLHSFDADTFHIAFAQGGRLASRGRDGRVVIFNVDADDANTPQPLLPTIPGHWGEVTFSADGRYLYAVGQDDVGVVRWDVSRPQVGEGTKLISASRFVHIAVSPDNSMLAATDWGSNVKLFDADGKSLGELPDADPGALAFSPDGARLLSTVSGGMLRLWDPRQVEPARTFAPQGTVQGHRAVMFLDAHVAAAPGVNLRIGLWDTRTGRRIAELDAQQKTINSLAVSPDGRMLVSCDDAGHIFVWEIERQSQ